MEVVFAADQPQNGVAGNMKSQKFEWLEWVNDGTQALLNGSDASHVIGECDSFACSFPVP
jgi:hypothetical protein